jgi:D-alanyl-D-alanine dipeptidase
VKHEGDGKAPAGIFTLSSVFGYATASEAGIPLIGLPYVQATESIECVDDTASAHYNTLLDRAGIPVDWQSSEHMRRTDELYRLGVFVDHNVAPAKAGAGSCIFIHMWRGPSSPTVGCTAGEPANITALVGWLHRSDAPLLVQLPKDEYTAHQHAWRLPPLSR